MSKLRSLQIMFTGFSVSAALTIAAAQTPEPVKALPAGRPRPAGVEKSSPAIRQMLALERGAAQDAERQRTLTTWKGTNVKPHPGARGRLLAQQRTIANQFSLQDPLPDQRRIHFQWCDLKDFVCQGWSGEIVNMAPSPSGMFVQVKVRPVIVSQSVRMSDYYLETYEYSQAGLRFVDGKGPEPEEDGGLVQL